MPSPGLGVDMQRREFITLLGGAAVAWPLAARAQPTQPLIGYISSRSAESDVPFLVAFRGGLGESGDVGKSAKFEFRWADNEPARLEGLAADLIKFNPAVILAGGGGDGSSCQKANVTHPDRFRQRRRSGEGRPCSKHQPARGQCHRREFFGHADCGEASGTPTDFVPKAKSIAVLVNPKIRTLRPW